MRSKKQGQVVLCPGVLLNTNNLLTITLHFYFSVVHFQTSLGLTSGHLDHVCGKSLNMMHAPIPSINVVETITHQPTNHLPPIDSSSSPIHPLSSVQTSPVPSSLVHSLQLDSTDSIFVMFVSCIERGRRRIRESLPRMQVEGVLFVFVYCWDLLLLVVQERSWL